MPIERAPPDRRPEPPPGRCGGVGRTREQQHEQEPEQGDREGDRDPQVDEEHEQDPAEQVLDVELLDVTGDGARRDVRPIPRFDVTGHACPVTGRDATVERDDVVADAARDQDVAVHDEDAAGDVPANGDPAVADEDPAVDGAVDGDGPVEGHDRTVHHLVGRHDDTAGDADAPVAPSRSVPCRGGGRRARREDEHRHTECHERSAPHVMPSRSRGARFARCALVRNGSAVTRAREDPATRSPRGTPVVSSRRRRHRAGPAWR